VSLVRLLLKNRHRSDSATSHQNVESSDSQRCRAHNHCGILPFDRGGLNRMVFNCLMMFAALVGALFPQAASNPKSDVQTQWQTTDQLCGQLELVAPKKKRVIVNGKSELHLYTSYLENATATLYPATSLGEECCEAKPIATANSRRYGAFEFEGVKPGTYWLRVQENGVLRLIPVRVTNAFDKKACHDPSVGRSFVVDSSPPKIEIRIR
jgi:hypothetical protein